MPVDAHPVTGYEPDDTAPMPVFLSADAERKRARRLAEILLDGPAWEPNNGQLMDAFRAVIAQKKQRLGQKGRR